MGCLWLGCRAVVDGVACQALCIALCEALGCGLCNRIASCCAWRGGTVRCAYGCVLCALYGMGTVIPCRVVSGECALVSISFHSHGCINLFCHTGLSRWDTGIHGDGTGWYTLTAPLVHSLYRILTCCQSHGHTVTVTRRAVTGTRSLLVVSETHVSRLLTLTDSLHSVSRLLIASSS